MWGWAVIVAVPPFLLLTVPATNFGMVRKEMVVEERGGGTPFCFLSNCHFNGKWEG